MKASSSTLRELCNEMSFDSAKKQACIMLGDIAKGNDPRTGKRIRTRIQAVQDEK
jgi:hypothetical protein